MLTMLCYEPMALDAAWQGARLKLCVAISKCCRAIRITATSHTNLAHIFAHLSHYRIPHQQWLRFTC